MRYLKASLHLSFFFLFSIAVGADKLINAEPVVSENFRINFVSQSDKLTINRMHRWVIHVEDLEGNVVEAADIRITGGMPEHDHGLPTEPRVTQYLGQGDYLLEGLKFHMAGLWQLDLIIEANGKRDSVSFSFRL